MAKSITKAELQAKYDAVVTELNTLRAINAQHQSLIEQARERIAKAQTEADAEEEMYEEIPEDDFRDSRPQYTAAQRAEWKAKQIAKIKPAYVKPAYVMPEWQVQRAAHMARLYEEAHAKYGFVKK